MRVLARCMRLVRPELLLQLGTEAFQRFAGAREPRVAMCALEL
jgi:uracil-DNA glycosylase